MSHPDRYEEFVRLLQEASPRILAYLDALLLDWNDAEDVFQESRIVLFGRSSMSFSGKRTSWLGRCESRKTRRCTSREVGRGDRLVEARATGRAMAAVTDADAARPDDALAALSGCMGQLPDGDRQLVQLCYGDGVPVRQMAVELGRSPQSVHNSLRRIRTTLLECVERVMNQEGR